MKCLVCGNDAASGLANVLISDKQNKIHDFKICKCENCGVSFLDPLPGDKFVAQFYEGGYHRKKEGGGNSSFCSLNRKLAVRAIKKIKPRGKVLDVGCGRGAFLEAMQNAGYEAVGVEPSQEGAAIAGRTDLVKVLKGSLENCDFEKGSFDVVTLWHVLEHVANPHLLLSKIQEIIKPDGVLILEVPNASSLEARLFKLDWKHLDVPRHLFFYNQRSLVNLLRQHGFLVQLITVEPFCAMPLTPFKSYLTMFLRKKGLEKIVAMMMFPVVMVIIFLKLFPIINLRSSIRLYAYPEK